MQPIVTKLDPLTNLTAHQLYLPRFEPQEQQQEEKEKEEEEEEQGQGRRQRGVVHEDTSTELVAWVERSSGRCFHGGEMYTTQSSSSSSSSPSSIGYRLSETAEFVRPGSMLPMVPTPTAQWNADHYANTSATCPTLSSSSSAAASGGGGRNTAQKPLPPALLGAASRAACTLEWHVYLGNATSGSGELLEDDGNFIALYVLTT
eukprot:COSAG06_NODE_980_length_11224_cov_324.998382_3_plen_204_part_00